MSDIYGLVDPRDNLVHYIGQTNQAGRRLIEHRNEHGRVNPQKTSWLQELAAEGLEPVLTVLETVEDASQVDERELYWIKYGRAQEWPLVNKAHGYETTASKLDALYERAIKLGLLPVQVRDLPASTKRAMLGVMTEQAERQLRAAHDAVESARHHAEALEGLLEKVVEVAHEFDS